MIFSELYSVYYNSVASILGKALHAPLSDGEIARIAKEEGFGESFLTIEKSLRDGAWPLLCKDGTAVIRNSPEMPLTTLQKRWLKAIANDPRIRLFPERIPDFPEVEPLFTPEDISVFDRYADGDDFTDENYIRNFRMILDAVKKRIPLHFRVRTQQGRIRSFTAQPESVEYSEKDDKFRVVTSGSRRAVMLNIGRILSCERAEGMTPCRTQSKETRYRRVVFEVTDERNSLERVLLHFAHFAKEAERIDDVHYRVTAEYDRDDETEIVIRILSFGPFVRVTAPDALVRLIKDRLIAQKSCGLL